MHFPKFRTPQLLESRDSRDANAGGRKPPEKDKPKWANEAALDCR